MRYGNEQVYTDAHRSLPNRVNYNCWLNQRLKNTFRTECELNDHRCQKIGIDRYYAPGLPKMPSENKRIPTITTQSGMSVILQKMAKDAMCNGV